MGYYGITGITPSQFLALLYAPGESPFDGVAL